MQLQVEKCFNTQSLQIHLLKTASSAYQVENSFTDHNGLSITVTPRGMGKKRDTSLGNIFFNQEKKNLV